MSNKRIALLGTLAATLALGAATPIRSVLPLLDGGDSAMCGYIAYGLCGSPAHQVAPTGDGRRGGHTECMTCVCGGTPCAAENCHGTCSQTFGSAEVRKQYDVAVNASMKGDVETLLRAAKDASGLVTFNADRSAIQVLTCSGTSVISSVPVSGALMTLAAAQLPSTVATIAYAEKKLHEKTATPGAIAGSE